MRERRSSARWLRVIPALLAVIELHVLLRSGASALYALVSHGLPMSASTTSTWLVLGLALALATIVRESGRGLLAALCAGELIAGGWLAVHGHLLPTLNLLSAASLLSILTAAALTLATLPALIRLLKALAGSARHGPPWLDPGQVRRTTPENVQPPSVPLIAGWSGRGPPSRRSYSAA